MKSKEQATSIVENAIKRLRMAIDDEDQSEIIAAMNEVEADPYLDLEIIDDELFVQWDALTEEAHYFLQD